MEAVEICPLRLFEEWAGDDLDRWKHLESRVLVHSSLGKCEVQTVTPGPSGGFRFALKMVDSPDFRIKFFDSTALRFFINSGSYSELRDELSRITDLEELKVRVKSAEKVRITREKAAKSRNVREVSASRRQLQTPQSQQELLQRVQEDYPELWNLPMEITPIVAKSLLEWPEPDVLAAASSFRSVKRAEEVKVLLKHVTMDREPAFQLFAALWYFQEWTKTRNLWSMASCSKHARRVDPRLALEFTELARSEISANAKSKEASAVMTTRSAAYCDLGYLMRSDELVGYVLQQIGPDYRALRVQGRVRFKLGDFQSGADSFARAAELDPSGGGSEVRGVLRELDAHHREMAITALKARDPVAFAWLVD